MTDLLPPPPKLSSGLAGRQTFAAHGSTTLWVDGAIVHVIGEGPFNREAVEAFSAQVLQLYRTLPAGQRFVNLTEMRGSLLATPEAWEFLGMHLLRVNASGLPLVATAWVVASDVEGHSLFLPRARSLFAEAGRCFEVFQRLAEAETWARARLLG